jgi:predicted  nucleic acid-binding Zn-ribbon protein
LIEAIQSLLRLQEIDLQLHAANEELESFPPLRVAAAAQRASELADIATAEQFVADQERQHRALETELGDVEAVLEKLNVQLYEVTSKQALEAIQNELDRAGAKQSLHEDLILDLLEKIDSGNADIEAAQGVAHEGEAQGAVEEAAYAKREKELADEVARLTLLRVDRATGLDPKVIRAYDASRRKRLPAVVFAEAKQCPVCQMVISPQKWIDLAVANALVNCGSCDRILYGEKVAKAEGVKIAASA